MGVPYFPERDPRECQGQDPVHGLEFYSLNTLLCARPPDVIELLLVAFNMLSQVKAAGACMENCQRLFKNPGYNPSPDECFDMLQRALLSLDKIFLDPPPQSDDKFVRESWSMIETARARMQSALLKLDDIKNGPERNALKAVYLEAAVRDCWYHA
ncbi:hypothetical protein N7517_011702 [Penicillium concentricum]|uniref:Uncharacterized protein n=1 Tax=Penicillium concentricum TaxID=293559 RepID=A0A9W9RBG7_9EURO|nr:uncharacterized protein N7517_011702 [Penicillium concentricum]KAJ5357093.1 hypothetical protein N7517_011702 [Penicillium concentricum]